MDKRELVSQLQDHLRAVAHAAHGASVEAATEAREGATSREKREDGRKLLEYGALARGQSARAERAFRELAELESLRVAPLARNAPIAVGALVEVEDEDSGEGLTFLIAPVGAGATLTGPGGDGTLTVVTPSSPIGRAVMGRRVDDLVDVTVRGEVREWRITWVE